MEVAMTATCVSVMVTTGTIQTVLIGRPPSRQPPRPGAWPRARRRGAPGVVVDRRRPPGLASNPTNRLRLSSDIGQERFIAGPLEALLEQRSQHDLQAHRELHRRGGPTGNASGAIDEILRQDDEHACFVSEHGEPPSVSIYHIVIL